MLERSRALQADLRDALGRLPSDEREVIDAVWHGEALGTLLWALQLAELPPYDEPYDAERIAEAALDHAKLRDEEEIDLERESARLWHWRARATELQAAGEVELPEERALLIRSLAAPAGEVDPDLADRDHPLVGGQPAELDDRRVVERCRAVRMDPDGDPHLGMRTRDGDGGRTRCDVLAAGEDPGDTGVASARKHGVEVAGEPRIGQMRVRVKQEAWPSPGVGRAAGPSAPVGPARAVPTSRAPATAPPRVTAGRAGGRSSRPCWACTAREGDR